MCKSAVLQSLGDSGVSALYRVVTNAFKQYVAQYTATAYLHSARTRSSATNDHLVENGKQILPEFGFKHFSVGQRNLFDYQGRFLVHLKKLSNRFRPSNYPTQMALKLFEEGTSDSLSGILPSLEIYTVGYVPNPFNTDIMGVYITHIQNGETQWVARLDDNGAESAMPEILPFQPYDPSSLIASTRITPKPGTARRSIPGRETSGAS